LTATHIISFLYKQAIWVGKKINLKIIHIIYFHQREKTKIWDEPNFNVANIIPFHHKKTTLICARCRSSPLRPIHSSVSIKPFSRRQYVPESRRQACFSKSKQKGGRVFCRLS
jgi:hypothetical protein